MQLNEFTITAVLNGKSRTVKIKTKPNSDDIDIYTCSIEESEFTQITKDNKQWKQIWGSLNDSEVLLLGNEIDNVLAE